MSEKDSKLEKEIKRMMEAYRERHKNDPVTDEKLRADIERFLKERNS